MTRGRRKRRLLGEYRDRCRLCGAPVRVRWFQDRPGTAIEVITYAAPALERDDGDGEMRPHPGKSDADRPVPGEEDGTEALRFEVDD